MAFAGCLPSHPLTKQSAIFNPSVLTGTGLVCRWMVNQLTSSSGKNSEFERCIFHFLCRLHTHSRSHVVSWPEADRGEVVSRPHRLFLRQIALRYRPVAVSEPTRVGSKLLHSTPDFDSGVSGPDRQFWARPPRRQCGSGTRELDRVVSECPGLVQPSPVRPIHERTSHSDPVGIHGQDG